MPTLLLIALGPRHRPRTAVKGITSLLEDLAEVGDNFRGDDLRAAVRFDSTHWGRHPMITGHCVAIRLEGPRPGNLGQDRTRIFQVGRDSRDSRSFHVAGTRYSPVSRARRCLRAGQEIGRNQRFSCGNTALPFLHVRALGGPDVTA